eukprot:TRINITY_DN7751_c0_g1_i1.p1 TRINITY_DN7751_c0_g1~~TRINITY_DN7751_c0_g1_i1.p1  ORF type:complete len:200 (+),score=53.29 TRINITY_DN7751_c0_g1_i1:33-602(+)
MSASDNALLQQALEAEALLDREISRLNSMKTDDYELLKEKRLKLMKLEWEQQQGWMQKGHGSYDELQNEKDWFARSKQSRNVICHFFRGTTWRCEIVDKHMTKLAPNHLEAKFCKIDAEKAPFLCERLKIWTLPTIVLIKDGVAHSRFEGFDAFGGHDEFTTKEMENALTASGIFQRGPLNDDNDENVY